MSEGSNEEEMVIRVRGLPWSATQDDIIEFFENIPIHNGEKGIHMTLSREGRPSGEAYVELENVDDISTALKKHNAHMGPRYIEVFEAKRSEMEWVIKRASIGPGQEDDCCVRLRGVPFGCSKEEIMQFFTGLEIVPNGIALPTDYQGKHTGEAYVQFVNKETTQKSMEKHKEKIAHRYIEMFKSNLNEIRAAMTPKMRGPGGPMGGFNRPAPYNTRDRFGGSNKYGSGRGRGRSFNLGFDFDDSSSNWGNANDSWMDRGSRGMGGSKSFRDRMDDRGSLSDGHFVHMRGLPFRATEMDIADFFRPLNPLNISIQVDNSNRPSGEADVEFSCHEEASKAMNKDKAKMQHRYIELFLNSSPPSNMSSYGPPMSPSMSSGNFGSSNNMGNSGFGGFSGGGNMGRMGGGSMMSRRFNDSSMNGNNSQNFRRGYNNYSSQNQMGGNNYSSFC